MPPSVSMRDLHRKNLIMAKGNNSQKKDKKKPSKKDLAKAASKVPASTATKSS